MLKFLNVLFLFFCDVYCCLYKIYMLFGIIKIRNKVYFNELIIIKFICEKYI